MKVILITSTPDAEKLISAAARLCYDKIGNIEELVKQECRTEFLDMLEDVGHTSPFEHASFSFGVEGVSRVLLAQITRHRIGVSFSARSQRYVDHGECEYVVSDILKRYPDAEKIYEEKRRIDLKYYDILKTELIKDITVDEDMRHLSMKQIEKLAQEEARYVIANGAETKFIMTMNIVSLWNLFRKRMCMRAQIEIRELAWEIFRLVNEKHPLLFRYAGPPCIHDKCRERKMTCGRPDAIKLLYDNVNRSK
jgi:thymidylate synthase (FAD)